jgi:hypothetical protein
MFLASNNVAIVEFDPPTNERQRNERLAQTLLDVATNPQHWNQKHWHCGTSHCFAGFAQLRARGLEFGIAAGTEALHVLCETDGHVKHRDISVSDDAMKYLGLTIKQADALFCATNKLEDIVEVIGFITATPYDSTKINCWDHAEISFYSQLVSA